MGRGPKDIHAHLIGDLLVVRLQGFLTAAEQQLVKSLPAEKGRKALRQVELNDQALDLGISLESLLSEENDETSNLAFKFRLRGALWLGGDPGAREANFRNLGVLYMLRSRAAHGNLIAEKADFWPGNAPKKKASANDVLRHGMVRCGDMLRKVIRDGAVPDWDEFAVGW